MYRAAPLRNEDNFQSKIVAFDPEARRRVDASSRLDDMSREHEADDTWPMWKTAWFILITCGSFWAGVIYLVIKIF